MEILEEMAVGLFIIGEFSIGAVISLFVAIIIQLISYRIFKFNLYHFIKYKLTH